MDSPRGFYLGETASLPQEWWSDEPDAAVNVDACYGWVQDVSPCIQSALLDCLGLRVPSIIRILVDTRCTYRSIVVTEVWRLLLNYFHFIQLWLRQLLSLSSILCLFLRRPPCGREAVRRVPLVIATASLMPQYRSCNRARLPVDCLPELLVLPILGNVG